jgi:pimeloyl-ACP methyl ester carboxylesterase
LDAFAIDLPGREGVSGDLAKLTLDECAASVSAQIDERVPSGRRVVLIAHSLGGVVVPGVVNRLGPKLIERIIFVAACVPSPGQSVLDTLPRLVSVLAYRVLRKPVISKVPYVIERFIFGNNATRTQRAQIHLHASAESSALIKEAIAPWSHEDILLGWVMPTHDRALPPSTQRRFIAELGADEVKTVDAGHELMITHPAELVDCLLAVLAA